jgi:hypothetical protein
MPRRAFPLLMIFCVLCATAAPSLAESKQAPSKQAQELRATGDLVPYQPSEAVLKALFTADEDAPRGVFGPVSAYVRARSCPAAWLIEKGELERIRELAARKDVVPYEFSLTLEEDCPGRVTHAVFVTAPGSTPEGWLKWRSQFHGRKAEGHYAAALAGLKKAEAAGLAPHAELRFLSVNGELLCTNLEDVLRAEGRLKPVFDLVKGAPAGR